VSVVRPRAACVFAAASAGLTFVLATALACADVGDTIDALPGIVRVPVVVARDRTGIGLAASAGYGWTESVLHDGDSHNRALGSLAMSLRATPYLAAGLRLDGRFDSSSGPGSTSGWVGDPRIEVRAGVPLGDAARLGGQLGVWFPGNDAPSWVASSTTPDASVLLTVQPPGSPVTIASRLGYRQDNSVKSAPDADRLALSDRLSLGLNAANAVLAGLGVSARVTPRLELLADVAWDLLVGSGSPGAAKSPMVVSAGARYGLDTDGRFELAAIADVSPSQRPEVAVGTPLVDIEPRIGGFIALVMRPTWPRPVEVYVPPRPAAPPPPPPQPVRAKLRGHVLAEDGKTPIAAHLTIRSGSAAPKETRTDDRGYFEVDDLDEGPATVEIESEGFSSTTRPVTLSASPVELDVQIAKALPSGQVRGLVRDFGGKPVVAAIRIEPLGIDVKLEPDGTFEANVAPGTYEVLIHATGYVEQKRRFVVERDGVTMLNVELRKGR